MYDVIVDIDGVLLDIHSGMTALFLKMGYKYDVNNVFTYDFNKSLPNSAKYRQLPPRKMIYDMFKDPALYKNSPSDWESIMFIRHFAKKGVSFLIYTISPNLNVQMAKQALFSQWFCGLDNIIFSGVIPNEETEMGFKAGVCGRTVVEDCHINLRNYDENVFKYLVDRPYNKKMYNPDYMDVFQDPTVTRCRNTHQAIEFAVAKASSLKLSEVRI